MVRPALTDAEPMVVVAHSLGTIVGYLDDAKVAEAIHQALT